MFYRFTVSREYPESTWIELWKLETSIHVSFNEYFQRWKSLSKDSLENALRACVNDWSAYYGANAGSELISTYNLNEYLRYELDDIFRFVQTSMDCSGMPLHVEVFQQSVAQSPEFALYIKDSGKRTEAFFGPQTK